MLDPILKQYPATAGLRVERIASGLINDTYRVGDAFVLQRLHRIFQAEVNLDIAAIVPRLRARGVPAPDVVPTRTGALWFEHPENGPLTGVWRMLALLPGRTLHRVESLAQVSELATMLARFHGALLDVKHDFAFARAGVHDTLRHMSVLEEALAQHASHRLRSRVEPMAREIAERWAAWGELPELPARIGHGDPKISNFLFDSDDRVVGVIDLDTMGWTTLDLELGDALRSWCNASTENEPEPRFDLERYQAALAGYRAEAAGWLTPAELAAFPASVERICLELAARFAADALHENYFGWDPAIAPTRGEHNLLRARGQLALARDVARQRPLLAQAVSL